MKEKMPTWPQMALILLAGTAVCLCAYLMANHREQLARFLPAVIALMVASAAAFLVTVYLFYLRPQYGSRSLPALLLFLAGHILIVLVLWRLGALGG